MQRALIDLARLAKVAHDHAGQLSRLDRELSRCALTPGELLRFDRWLSGARSCGRDLLPLRHRLSDYTEHLECALRPQTSLAERVSAHTHRAAVRNVLDRGAGLGTLLPELASAAGARSHLRDTSVRTVADRNGRSVQFPEATLIDRRLSELGHVIVSDIPIRSFKAIVSLCAVLNLHPLTDGNGRAARILFNAVLLAEQASDDLYLPLYDIKQASRFGFELALRELELTGTWSPLVTYFGGICEVVRNFRQSTEAHQR